MGAAEFAEWQAYDSLEPIGQRRADMRTALLAALIANQWRGKDADPVTPHEMLKMLPWWDEKRERRAVLGEAEAALTAQPTQGAETHWTVRTVEQMWDQMSKALNEPNV